LRETVFLAGGGLDILGAGLAVTGLGAGAGGAAGAAAGLGVAGLATVFFALTGGLIGALPAPVAAAFATTFLVVAAGLAAVFLVTIFLSSAMSLARLLGKGSHRRFGFTDPDWGRGPQDQGGLSGVLFFLIDRIHRFAVIGPLPSRFRSFFF
jgi:hypothetical protein